MRFHVHPERAAKPRSNFERGNVVVEGMGEVACSYALLVAFLRSVKKREDWSIRQTPCGAVRVRDGWPLNSGSNQTWALIVAAAAAAAASLLSSASAATSPVAPPCCGNAEVTAAMVKRKEVIAVNFILNIEKGGMKIRKTVCIFKFM